MKKEDLITLKDKLGNTFDLTDRVQLNWNNIGLKIGMTPNELQGISKRYPTDAERLNTVWDRWFKSDAPTWDKLKKLLNDVGCKEVSNEYFEFLKKR